jgi:uncharacterized protein involved in outer membrane biogenesis
MKTWRRVALGFAGVVALAAIAGVLAFHALVDPERIKRVAREKAQATWARDLAIGDVSIDLWPLPAFHAEKVALANPAWAKEPNLLYVEHASARLELLPLLAGKTRLKSLALDGVRVSLEVAPDGATSLPGESTTLRKPESRPTEGLLNLQSLSITNADILHRTSPKTATLWHIDEASAEAQPGLRDVELQASVSRNRRPLKVEATLDDLSRMGNPGATTNGKIDLYWGKTRLSVTGRVPLEPGLKGYALTGDLKSASPNDLLEFFGIKRRPMAAAEARFEAREAGNEVEVSKLAIALGKLRLSGDAQLVPAGPKPVINMRLQADRLDWAQATLDAGEPPVPALKPEELFHDHPLAWPLLVAMQGKQGTIDLKIGSLILRNGVELRNASAHATFDDDRLNMSAFSTQLLGGSATGSMQFEGRRKSVRMNFDGTNLLLERWFHERGSDIPFRAGPMKVKATFTSAGNSMRDLASSMTGPVTIRMGPGVWASKKAGEAESMMTGALAGKDASEIDFQCIGASFPFANGRATANPLVGFGTTASHLVTEGYVDFREAALDLRGRVRPKSGAVGLSAIAGDVKITGPLRHPKMSLDPVGTPAAVARAGAAIATLGLSAKATALADAAETRKSNPCDVVMTARTP